MTPANIEDVADRMEGLDFEERVVIRDDGARLLLGYPMTPEEDQVRIR